VYLEPSRADHLGFPRAFADGRARLWADQNIDVITPKFTQARLAIAQRGDELIENNGAQGGLRQLN